MFGLFCYEVLFLPRFVIIWLKKRESWLPCFGCLLSVIGPLMFSVSCSKCHGLVCSV